MQSNDYEHDRIELRDPIECYSYLPPADFIVDAVFVTHSDDSVIIGFIACFTL